MYIFTQTYITCLGHCCKIQSCHLPPSSASFNFTVYTCKHARTHARAHTHKCTHLFILLSLIPVHWVWELPCALECTHLVPATLSCDVCMNLSIHAHIHFIVCVLVLIVQEYVWYMCACKTPTLGCPSDICIYIHIYIYIYIYIYMSSRALPPNRKQDLGFS